MANNDLKKKFNLQFVELKQIILKWDPYSLVEDGAPDDEHNDEIVKILSGLRLVASSKDTAKLLSAIFNDAYNYDSHSKEYEEIAEKIYSWWIENKD